MDQNPSARPTDNSATNDKTERASSGGGYGLWGLLGLLGLFGLGRRNRAVRTDMDTTRDRDMGPRDVRRVA
jgi:MYXO-CTERM domain-containing protein